MSNSRLAGRYAKPLIELAVKQGILDEIYADMKNFVSICKSNRDFVLMLKSPIIPHLKKADILHKIFDKKVNRLTSAAFDIIVRKNRERYLMDIAEAFINLYNEIKGYQEVTISTSVKIDDHMRSAFEKLVKEISGKTPMMVEKVDPSLIGGYVLKMGDQQLDESISGQLKELELKFKKETI